MEVNYSMGTATPIECSTGYQSTCTVSNWASAANSSEPSPFEEYPSQQPTQQPYLPAPQLPPPPPPPQQQQQAPVLAPPPLPMLSSPAPAPLLPPQGYQQNQHNHHHNQHHHQVYRFQHHQRDHHQQQLQQQQQMSQALLLKLQAHGLSSEKIIDEFVDIIKKENDEDDDEVVLENAFCLLFRFTRYSPEICGAMANSPEILNRLNYILTNQKFKNNYPVLSYGAGNLSNLSYHEFGLEALTRCQAVESLIHTLKAEDDDVQAQPIPAIHNLLLDCRYRSAVKAELVKERQNSESGLKYIIRLLRINRKYRTMVEFEAIILDCLQILAHDDVATKNVIRESIGIHSLLNTISKNLEPHDDLEKEILIKAASKLLKSLSADRTSKGDIIDGDGVTILTRCIGLSNQEIVADCLWTLRNLSDLLNNSNAHYIEQLIHRLLEIFGKYTDEPCMIACALCILENLTYNNQPIKQMICMNGGIDWILSYIQKAVVYSYGSPNILHILDPALCALCNLLNQEPNPHVEDCKRRIIDDQNLSYILLNPRAFAIYPELISVVDKIANNLSNFARN